MHDVKSKKWRPFPFHPLLFAIYPVLAMLASNLDQMRPQAALRAGLLSLAAGLAAYGAFWLILRKPRRAALLASLWLLLFFTYGHVYQLMENRSVLGFVYGKHRYLIVLWLALLALGTWWLLRRLKNTRNLNQVANLVSIALLVFPLYQITSFEIRARQLSAASTTAAGLPTAAGSPAAAASTSPASTDDTPDIYYILLDGYSRADVIQKLYGLDITPFMDELKSIGFVLPDCAQSNYGITALSMYSTLNMQYLDAPGNTFPIGSDRSKVDYQTMQGYLAHSQARAFLQQRGYKMVTFETGYWWLDITDADAFIVANNNPLKKYSQNYAFSNFEDMFLRSTALRVLTEANAAIFAPLTRRIKTPKEQHYEWVKFELDQLDQVPEIPGKKFVYFHALAPHDPFVFAADGSFRDIDSTNSDTPGYPDEVTYLNKRILAIVRNLIAKSKTSPVIIIQGDHGWDPRYRMQIFNAYYLPGGGNALVYPTITPVNSFRLIFDRYFGAHLGLQKDQSYFSMGADFPQYGVKSRPYQLTPEPNTCLGAIR